MFRSLRFRLPALFLLGIVAATLASTAIAIRVFRDYADDRALAQLRLEAKGTAELYAEDAIKASDEGRAVPVSTAKKLERATGDNVYFVGVGEGLFPNQRSPLTTLDPSPVDWQARRVQSFEFTPPGHHRTYLAVAYQLRLGGSGGKPFGAIVVAEPKGELRDRVFTLIQRLALAFLGGLLVAAGLAWYLTRRITNPVRALATAADEVSRRNYDVELPPKGAGEIGDLANRFRGMTTRLREASELERNFLMTVSHELKTPLTAIRGHVAAVREGIADDPKARELSLAAVASETERLDRLVAEILDLAKLETHRFAVREEEVDMQRLVERAYGLFDREAAQRGIEYRQRVGASPQIVSDGDRVLQIITNLLSNAFRWTPDGGRVELALDAENGSVSVAVADSGPGIAPEERERIFRPFWTRDGRGTGLGLAIARELALALGGRIELESAPGKGSRFELLLPSERP
jgi:signal transduction histidine kinase